MKSVVIAAVAVLLGAGAVQAESHLGGGDPAVGEQEFGKCKACHMVVADDGTAIVRGGRTGPNLFGVIGRQAGIADFRYGASLVQAGEAGLVWDQDSFAKWMQDPRAFLVEYLGDAKARSKMSFKLNSGIDDIYAYLVSVGPQAAN